MPLRVIQWSTGNVGRYALRAILGHPELELAGLWVHSEKKAGRDAGELPGVRHVQDVEGREHALLDAVATHVSSVGLGRHREAARHAHTGVAEVADHLAERRVLASDRRQVGQRDLGEGDDESGGRAAPGQNPVLA